MEFPSALRKFIGVLFIIMSVGFVARLILFIPILTSQFAKAVEENLGFYWGEFTFTFLIYVFFWVVTYFMFRYGRNLYHK